jgi:hypothetical protein
MSEIINIASFEFDSSKVEKSLETLQNSLFDIQKEQKRYAAANSVLQKQYDALSKQQEALRASNQKDSQAYKDVTAQLKAVETQQRGVFQSQQDLAIQASVVRKEYNDTVAIQKTLITSTGAMVTKEEALTAALERQVGTRAEAKKSNIELNRLKDQLNPKIKEEAELLDELNAKVNENNDLLKASGSEREKQISNVGNYKQSIVEAAEELNIFNGGIGGFISRAQESGGAGQVLSGSLKGAAQGFAGVTKGALTFIATPIGAILAAVVLAFTLVKNAMNRSEESTKKITKIFTIFGGVANKILSFLEPLGEFLIDGLVAGFELAGQAADKALSLIGDGLAFLGFDDAAEGVRGFQKEVKTAAIEAAALADAEAELAKQQRLSQKTQLDYQKEAEKLRQARDNEALSIKERIAANEQLGVVLKKQLAEELKIAELALVVANARIKAEGSTKETLDAQAEALTTISDIQERITGQESEQLTNRVALQKEAADKAKEIRDKQIDAAIKKSKEELDLFIAQQGFRAKSAEEQLLMDQKVADKSIAILKQELNAKKISRLQYETEVLTIQQDLLKKQAELTIANAQTELEEYLRIQQEKLDGTDRLNAEIVNSQRIALLDIKIAEETFQKERRDLGLINEQEYQAELLRIKEENLVATNELEKRYAQQAKEDRDTARALEFEAEILTLEEQNANKFIQAQAQADFEYGEQQIKLAEQREAGLINEANYNLALENLDREHAEAKKAIETELFNFKLNSLSTTFGNVAEVLGKETAAGKAAGIAQATINTFQGVSEVWKSPAVFPEPYNTILKGIQSGITVASGFKSIKAITSTKTPKGQNPTLQGLATGGVVKGGVAIKRNNGDDRLITAKTGEVVLTENQQRIIGADMFAIAGVPGFASGGVVGASALSTVQRSITDGLGTADLSSTLAEAVKAGASEGSAQGTSTGAQRGISDLSENRQIQQNATF